MRSSGMVLPLFGCTTIVSVTAEMTKRYDTSFSFPRVDVEHFYRCMFILGIMDNLPSDNTPAFQ